MTSFVLVHGAWHGGWCWTRLARLLRNCGHDVLAPSLTGLADRAHLLTADTALRTHIDDIRNLIEWEDLEHVVLCGHSYGGLVIAGVADAIPGRIAASVYLDALVIADGQSAMDLLTEQRRALLHADVAAIDHVPVVLPPDPAIWGVNAADRAFVRAKLTPHPLASLEQPIALKGAYRERPRTYVWARRGTSERFYRQCEADPDWATTAMDGGHNLMIDDPAGVANILVKAAA